MNWIDKLLAAMTVEEKIGQLNMVAAGCRHRAGLGKRSGRGHPRRTYRLPSQSLGRRSFMRSRKSRCEKTRLGIPLLTGLDVLHGHRTIFPIPLAEACVLRSSLVGSDARGRPIEAAADGINMIFAPMLDIARDPRWGRIAEGAGEDPWSPAQFAKAKVRGFQGAACPAAWRALVPLPPRPSISAPMARPWPDATTPRPMFPNALLHEVYLPPFAAAVAAGCAADDAGLHGSCRRSDDRPYAACCATGCAASRVSRASSSATIMRSPN